MSRLALKLEAGQEREEITHIKRFALEFRQIVDQHIGSLESRFEWQRPFLLVFDTFEIVQYRQEDVEAMEQFIEAFSERDERSRFWPFSGRDERGKPWPRMRLIIAGRKKVDNFLGKPEELTIEALDPDGSAQLLVALRARCRQSHRRGGSQGPRESRRQGHEGEKRRRKAAPAPADRQGIRGQAPGRPADSRASPRTDHRSPDR